MGKKLKYCVIGLAATLISGSAFADEHSHFEGHAFGKKAYLEEQPTFVQPRYDRRVAAAAARLAAAKLGTIRGSIGHDQSPIMVEISEKKTDVKAEIPLLPRLSGSPHPAGTEMPPPIVSNDTGDLDAIMTGTVITQPAQQAYSDGLYWDQFDSKGRRLKRIN